MTTNKPQTFGMGTLEEIVVTALPRKPRGAGSKSRGHKAQRVRESTANQTSETLSVDSSLQEFVDRAITSRKRRRLASESKRRSGRLQRKVHGERGK